ncbi:MAG: hypothetical protein WAM14_26235 [Candidatus Nitrosopolaris sp.]
MKLFEKDEEIQILKENQREKADELLWNAITDTVSYVGISISSISMEYVCKTIV